MCIWGENPPALVERFAQQLGIADLDEMFLLQSVVRVRCQRLQRVRGGSSCRAWAPGSVTLIHALCGSPQATWLLGAGERFNPKP